MNLTVIWEVKKKGRFTSFGKGNSRILKSSDLSALNLSPNAPSIFLISVLPCIAIDIEKDQVVLVFI